jgi:hypothetical protein
METFDIRIIKSSKSLQEKRKLLWKCLGILLVNNNLSKKQKIKWQEKRKQSTI